MKGMDMLKILLRQHWMLVCLLSFLAVSATFVYDAHREATSTRYIKRNIPAAELQQLEGADIAPPDSENGFSEITEAAIIIRNIRLQNPIDIHVAFGKPFSPEQKELLQEYINRNSDALSLIYEAIEHPYIYVPHCHTQEQYDQAYYKIWGVTSLLNYRILDAAVRNDVAQLDEAINTSRRFFQKLSHRNCLEDEVTRLSILSWHTSYIKKAFCYAFPSPAAIRKHLTLFPDNEKLLLERARMALMNETINLSTSHEFNTEFSNFLHNQSDVMRLLGMATMEWSQAAFIGAKLFSKRLTHTLAVGRADIYTAATDYKREREKRPQEALHRIFHPYGTVSTHIYVFFARETAHSNTARVALSSLLYYHDHKQMPDTLENLLPDYLDALPRDPFTPDQPIRYRIDGDIARFYSIGENEIDDNGFSRSHNSQTLAMDNPNCDDIVFRLKVPQENIPLVPPSTEELTGSETSITGEQTS